MSPRGVVAVEVRDWLLGCRVTIAAKESTST
jgi:hypothetical protein